MIAVRDVDKSFCIPSVRRDTVREHFLDLFRPRPMSVMSVLNGVTFTVKRGESLGIMGRNGCGKSTLLKILAGIYRQDRGEVAIDGAVTPILELGVGWSLELNAIDNICLVGTVMGLSLDELRASTREILAFAELERFANLPLKYYSSGMATRLAYAVAFRAVRDVLILDEVLAVGDAGFQARCERRFQELRRAGHTIVLVSHTTRFVEHFTDRALLLEGTRLVLDDSPSRVCAEYSRLLQEPAPADGGRCGGGDSVLARHAVVG